MELLRTAKVLALVMSLLTLPVHSNDTPPMEDSLQRVLLGDPYSDVNKPLTRDQILEISSRTNSTNSVKDHSVVKPFGIDSITHYSYYRIHIGNFINTKDDIPRLKKYLLANRLARSSQFKTKMFANKAGEIWFSFSIVGFSSREDAASYALFLKTTYGISYVKIAGVL